jgi:uncharacterized membrane protein YozB (DUF420 family)
VNRRDIRAGGFNGTPPPKREAFSLEVKSIDIYPFELASSYFANDLVRCTAGVRMAAMSVFLIISTVWAVIALLLLIVAWRAARMGTIALHRNIMILLTAGAWIFIFNYIFVQRYGGGDPVPFPREYVPWIALHGSLGLVPLIGASCLVLGRLMTGRNSFSSHFNRHHKVYGRAFIVVWLFTHLGGIFNAVFLR